MVDFEKLASAMGDLEEDTVVDLLKQVMAEGGADAQKALDACTATVKIPMNPRCESLNAAVAAAVLLWEGWR